MQQQQQQQQLAQATKCIARLRSVCTVDMCFCVEERSAALEICKRMRRQDFREAHARGYTGAHMQTRMCEHSSACSCARRRHDHFLGSPHSPSPDMQYSGTPGKRHRMREALLWEDPPSYFDHPKGFISLKCVRMCACARLCAHPISWLNPGSGLRIPAAPPAPTFPAHPPQFHSITHMKRPSLPHACRARAWASARGAAPPTAALADTHTLTACQGDWSGH